MRSLVRLCRSHILRLGGVSYLTNSHHKPDAPVLSNSDGTPATVVACQRAFRFDPRSGHLELTPFEQNMCRRGCASRAAWGQFCGMVPPAQSTNKCLLGWPQFRRETGKPRLAVLFAVVAPQAFPEFGSKPCRYIDEESRLKPWSTACPWPEPLFSAVGDKDEGPLSTSF